MVDRQRLDLRGEPGKAAQRHLDPVRPRHIDLRQRARLAAELRLDLEDHLVLVGRGVHRRDLALAERVIEGLVDQ